MKTILTALTLALPAFTASASSLSPERDVEIVCSLSTEQSATVEKISLYSATDEITLAYRDGSEERVKTEERNNQGLFGNEDFSADLVWNNGRTFAPATKAGDLYVKHTCYLTPTIAFERCISQGDGDTARYSGVRMNLGGKPLAFFGKNICARTDRSAR